MILQPSVLQAQLDFSICFHMTQFNLIITDITNSSQLMIKLFMVSVFYEIF